MAIEIWKRGEENLKKIKKPMPYELLAKGYYEGLEGVAYYDKDSKGMMCYYIFFISANSKVKEIMKTVGRTLFEYANRIKCYKFDGPEDCNRPEDIDENVKRIQISSKDDQDEILRIDFKENIEILCREKLGAEIVDKLHQKLKKYLQKKVNCIFY